MGKRSVKVEETNQSSQQEQEASASFLHQRVARILNDYNTLVQAAKQMEKLREHEEAQISGTTSAQPHPQAS